MAPPAAPAPARAGSAPRVAGDGGPGLPGPDEMGSAQVTQEPKAIGQRVPPTPTALPATGPAPAVPVQVSTILGHPHHGRGSLRSKPHSGRIKLNMLNSE